jgi:NAD(P)-dependent dehydrogenase (short-subunit alcohol dehydrogenase family)
MEEAGRAGKVAIITGAAGGIGRRLVESFCAMGYRIGACDVDVEGLKALEARFGSRLVAKAYDIADPMACEAHAREVIETFGGLHVVINNAALGMNAIRDDYFADPVRFEEIELQTWARMIAVNLNGPVFLTRSALPRLKAQGWGRIINVTTSFFTMLNRGFGPYGAAKAGLEAWSASLAKELDGSGITVNIVVPGGPADTPMVPAGNGFRRENLVAPELMAAPMLWLCSDAAGHVNGRRFIAADWAPGSPIQPDPLGAPIGWPDLAANPVWST